jgi:hypothetical protein
LWPEDLMQDPPFCLGKKLKKALPNKLAPSNLKYSARIQTSKSGQKDL